MQDHHRKKIAVYIVAVWNLSKTTQNSITMIDYLFEIFFSDPRIIQISPCQ